ncbi:helix-turn-helix domain-containing protein [Thermodesulfovibrionales bacterium]|nr:helix-turn-helix domain-containing protein [Thermodesulfovibrionales bacterium]
MAEKTVTVQNEDTLMEVLRHKKDPELKRKLSFISLVAAGMEVKEAASHFGTCVTTGYNWIRHWMTEGIERLRPKKSPGRPPALNEEMLERLKGLLETRPYWSLREVRRLIKRTRLSKA